MKQISINLLDDYISEGLISKNKHPYLDLYILNYTEKVQYGNLWDTLLLQTRGLVIDFEGNIIAKPFAKIFNMEENKHTPTEEFEVFEKMDGSLGILFCYKGEWIMATRGSFISDQAIRGFKMLKELSVFKNYPTVGLNKDWTYLFEIIYQENRIVCDYDFEGLILLGAYNVRTLKEIDFKELQKSVGLFTDLKIVRKYDGVKDYFTLKNMVKNNAEGFVVRFSNGDRMKIKGEEYIRLHKIMTNISTTSIWEVLSAGGNMEDLLTNIPDEFYGKIKDYENSLRYSYMRIQEYAGKLFDSLYESYDGELPNRKKYAEWVKNQPNFIQPVLFKMYDKKDYSLYIWKLIKPEFKKI